MLEYLRRKWPILAVSGAVLGLAVILFVPSAHAAAARCRRGARLLTMAEAQALARKWAKKRGIPASWILATIFVESGRDACKKGDYQKHPDGASIGLMQVNTVAHPDLMEKLGLSREDLFDPDKAVEIGSYILAQRAEQIMAALAGRPAPGGLGVLVQLAYKGRVPQILTQLARGEDPREIHGADVLARRSNALVQAEALV